MEITYQNFFLHSKASFKGCKKPKRKPDFISSTGSTYWYLNGYVIRYSDHWVRRNPIYSEKYGPRTGKECKSIVSCLWSIKEKKSTPYKWTCGKCKLSDFTDRCKSN